MYVNLNIILYIYNNFIYNHFVTKKKKKEKRKGVK